MSKLIVPNKDLLIPGAEEVAALLRQDFETIERWASGIIATTNEAFIFSFPGPLATSTSGRFYLESDDHVTGLEASLATAGTTVSTSFQLLKNGVAIATSATSMATGVNEIQTTLPSSVVFIGPHTDYLQVQLTAIDNVATDLIVQVQRLGS